MISEIEIRLRADIARLQQDMDRARQAVSGGLDRINAAVGKTVGLLGGLAVGASAVTFAQFIKGSIDAADALNDLSSRTSVAIEDLAGLDFAARMAGSTLEGVAGAVSKLSLNIGKDTEKFRELGVTAEEPVEALKQLADIFKTIQDPQQRAAFGAAALGKSWAEVAPLLDEGSEGITKLMERGKQLSGVTEEVARDAGLFNDKLDELSFAAQGFGTRLAADLLPLMNQLVDDLESTGNAAEKTSSDFSLLSEAFRAIVILGGNVSFTFKAVGTEIGVVVAQVAEFGRAAGSFLSLDWEAGMRSVRAALSMGDEAKEDAVKAREAFDTWEKGWATAAKKVKATQEEIGIAKFMEDVDKAIASGATTAQVQAFVKAEEVAAARKKASEEVARAAEKEQEAYKGLIAAVREKIATNTAEMASSTPLLESQKMRVKLDQDLRNGKLVLTKAHEAEVRAALDSLEGQEKLQRALKNTAEAQAELQKEREAAVKTATSEAEAQERLVAEFGKTKLAIERATLARLEEQLAQRSSLGLTLDEIEQLEKLIAAKRRAVDAGGQLEVLEDQKKATEEATKAQQDMWASIDRTAHDTFVSILDGGKDLGQRLKDALKNTFFDWLYQMTVKKWILNIGIAGTGGGVAGLAQAATGANAAGGLGGVLGMLGGIGSGASQTAGALMAGNIGFMDTLSSGFSALTSGSLSGFSAGASSLLGVAGPIAAAIAIGRQLNKAISGGFSMGGLSKITDNIGVVGGVLNRAFGRKAKEVTAQGITGSFGAEGFTGQAFQEWFQKGGWFRSDRRGRETSAVDTETAGALSSGFTAVREATAAYAQALGLPVDQIKNYTKQINLALTGDAAKDQQALVNLIAGVGDEMASSLIPNIAALSVEGEKASDTLARVATNYTSLDAVLRTIGQTFGAVGVDSLAARERLISLSGGIEALATNVAGFAQNFLTEAERLAPVAEQVTKALSDMGLGWVDTREEFKQVVLATDKTTEAGAKQFAMLMSLQAAFAALYPSTEDLNRALQEQKEAQEQAAAAAAQALRDKVVGNLKDAISESLGNIGRMVDEQKAQEKAAFESMIAGIQDGVDRANAKIGKLRELAGVLNSFNPGQATGQQAVAARQVGAAQVQSALAIARATGIMPTAESLKFAVSALGQDISGQFATSQDYQRSQLEAANDISALAKLANNQLSTEERTLKVLQEQKFAAETAYAAQLKTLDAMLQNAREQAELAINGNTMISSIGYHVSNIPSALTELQRLIAAIKIAAPPPATAPGTGTTPGTTPGTGTGTGATPGGGLDQVRQIEQAYNDLLGRGSDAEGLAYWLAAANMGISLDQIRENMKNSEEYQALQAANQSAAASFAAGAQAGTMAQETSAALLAEMQSMNAQLTAMQSSMERTAANTGASATSGQQLAQQFDQVTAGGNVLLTETVN